MIPIWLIKFVFIKYYTPEKSNEIMYEIFMHIYDAIVLIML